MLMLFWICSDINSNSVLKFSSINRKFVDATELLVKSTENKVIKV